jgi:hypothetical protein
MVMAKPMTKKTVVKMFLMILTLRLMSVSKLK